MSEGFTIRAPGKLILCGEYAVMHGAPALCAAVARHATCTATPIASGTGLRLTAMGQGELAVLAEAGNRHVHFDPAPANPRTLALLQAVLEERAGAGGLPQGYAFNVDSSALSESGQAADPEGRKLGLGSSGAAAVALTAALDVAATGAQPTSALRRQWFESAHRAHLRAQGGVGSGVDAAASSLGSMIVYRRHGDDPKDAEIARVRWEKLGVRLLAVWTGTSASTMERIRQVEAWRLKDKEAAQIRFAEMSELAEEAVQYVDAGDRRGFLSAMNAYGAQMSLLGQESGADIVGPVHQRIRDLASAQECAAKPSGAGGGDVAICFCPDGWAEKELAEDLEKAGFPPLSIDFDNEGVALVR